MITIALTTALLAGGGPQGVDLAFAPREGLRLAKTVLVRHELSLDEMGATQDGGPLMREDVGGWLAGGTRQSFVDEYLAAADGRPTVFRRTLNTFEGNARVTLTGRRGAQEFSARFTSMLAGLPVLHTWVPEEGTWGRCFDHLVAEEELLEVLLDDADFLGLLPSGPIEVGASWSASPEALRSLLTPGGNTGAQPDEDGYFARMVEVGIGGDLADVLGKELGGSVSVTCKELREAEGRSLALLEVQFSVVSERDRTRIYLMGMPKEEKREGSELRQVLVLWVAEGTAEILWDLEAGHAAGATVRAHETLTAEVSKATPMGGGAISDVTQRSTYSGQLEIEHKIREAQAKTGEDQEAGVAAEKGKQKPGKQKPGKKKKD